MPELNEQARCLKCDYLLRGLDSRTCPECGQGFDPDNPRTYWVPVPFVAGRVQVAVLVLLTLADLAYPTITGPHIDPPDVLLGFLAVLLSLCCALGVARSERGWQQVLGWSCAAVQTVLLFAGSGTGVTWGQLMPWLAVYRGDWNYAHPGLEPIRVLVGSLYLLVRYFGAPYLTVMGLTELWVRVRSRTWVWGVGLAVVVAEICLAIPFSAMGYSGPGTGPGYYISQAITGPLCAGMLLVLPVRPLLFGTAVRRRPRPPRAVPGRRVLLAFEAAVLLLIVSVPLVAACRVPHAIAEEGPRRCRRELQSQRFFAVALFDDYVRRNGHPPAMDLQTFSQWLGRSQPNAFGACPVSGQPYVLESDPQTGKVRLVCPFHHERSEPLEPLFPAPGPTPGPTSVPATQAGAAGP
jgi:hypothetical protein